MKIAVFTMAYNESIFLPLWISHYARQFGYENIYIIDVGSTDGSTKNLSVSVMHLPRTQLDEDCRARFVHNFHASLLSYYDVVIFTDTDELLVADPSQYDSLIDFLSKNKSSPIAPIGLHLFQDIENETAISRDEPLLAQRRFVQFDGAYCKPIIAREPTVWRAGFHVSEGNATLSKHLFMFHVKAVDRDIFRSERRIKKQAGISRLSFEKGYGTILSVPEEELMKQNFPLISGSSKNISPDFDFRRCIQNFFVVKNGKNRHPRGRIYRVPERFTNALPSLSGEFRSPTC